MGTEAAMTYSWLTDEQLESRVAELYKDAQDAPKTGNAWQQRSNDWFAAAQELDRRKAQRVQS